MAVDAEPGQQPGHVRADALKVSRLVVEELAAVLGDEVRTVGDRLEHLRAPHVVHVRVDHEDALDAGQLAVERCRHRLATRGIAVAGVAQYVAVPNASRRCRGGSYRSRDVAPRSRWTSRGGSVGHEYGCLGLLFEPRPACENDGRPA